MFSLLNNTLDFLFGAWREKIRVPPIRNELLLDSATTLAAKIRGGEVTSTEIVEAYIERIVAVNPIVNCVSDVNYEQALQLAKRVDELIASASLSPEEIEREYPFLGVPFTTKNSIAVKNLKQTAGMVDRVQFVAKEDARCISLIRKVGGIPLAVTNVSELAMWWDCYNLPHGKTNNPYDTRRTVGGSSGGEACLNAVAGTAFGIGSDIGGSVRIPAAFNGVFGHKPTEGIVSNEGQFPPVFNELQLYLCTGPICRFASDLKPILKVISDGNADKLKLDEEVNVDSLNFFFMYDDGGSLAVSKVHGDIVECMKFIKMRYPLQRCEDLELDNMKYSLQMWLKKIGGGGSVPFSEYLAESERTIDPRLRFFKWLIGRSKHTLPTIGFVSTENYNGRDSYGYQKYVDMCDQMREDLEAKLGDNGVLIYPTHPTSAPFHYKPIVTPFNFAYTAIFNVLGLPATQCPVGFDSQNMPIGVQVVAKRYNDHLTLAVARDLEDKFRGWKPPCNYR